MALLKPSASTTGLLSTRWEHEPIFSLVTTSWSSLLVCFKIN
jgi:hypothetical protein